jgi:alkanesulfonate monooxygenase SsuD/methylene tetrahydromethanopterin reductase-like flavin-dependent oxidoreductase (luciferase family)
MTTAARQPLTLSVIDLCKRTKTQSAKQSLEETLALAELVDSLGYKRFWVGEHHVANTAEACPEVYCLADKANSCRLWWRFASLL